MIKFEKISYEQYRSDYLAIFYPDTLSDISEEIEKEIRDIYDNIKLPERSTKFSAGYDFYTPISIYMEDGTEIVIPTGIKATMEDDNVLVLVPRSSLGMRYYARLSNTLAVIDKDYINASNEGHIMIKLRVENNLDAPLRLKAGDRFVQGIFIKYFVTDDDSANTDRTGGIGSTGK